MTIKKQAGIGESIGKTLGSAVQGAAILGEKVFELGAWGAVGIPVIAGVSAGILASKVTSPSAQNVANDERIALNKTLDENINDIKRRRAYAALAQQTGKDSYHGSPQKEIRL